MSETKDSREQWNDFFGRLDKHEDALREKYRDLADRLPKSADGMPITPGATLYHAYAGSIWIAKVVGVGLSTIDIQYQNDSTLRAQYAIARLVNPADWYADRDHADIREAVTP